MLQVHHFAHYIFSSSLETPMHVQRAFIFTFMVPYAAIAYTKFRRSLFHICRNDDQNADLRVASQEQRLCGLRPKLHYIDLLWICCRPFRLYNNRCCTTYCRLSICHGFVVHLVVQHVVQHIRNDTIRYDR